MVEVALKYRKDERKKTTTQNSRQELFDFIIVLTGK